MDNLCCLRDFSNVNLTVIVEAEALLTLENIVMSRLLLTLLLTCFGSFTLSAQVPDEVHEKCKDVTDYVGCVQIFTGSVVTKQETGIPEVKELKESSWSIAISSSKYFVKRF